MTEFSPPEIPVVDILPKPKPAMPVEGRGSRLRLASLSKVVHSAEERVMRLLENVKKKKERPLVLREALKRNAEKSQLRKAQITGMARLSIIGGILGGTVAAPITAKSIHEFAQEQPDVATLSTAALDFQTSKIITTDGQVIDTIAPPGYNERKYVSLPQISPYMLAATIGKEDPGFWINTGVSPKGIAGAFWRNSQAGEAVSGGSTITMQLSRNVYKLMDTTWLYEKVKPFLHLAH